MKCKICGSTTKQIFSAKILAKYNVDYLQCEDCGFIQTEEEYWLKESYEEAITSLDIGLVTRNMLFSKITASLIRWFFLRDGQFLDYAGGHGLFVRMMRDRGFDFLWQDAFCENTFAKNFEYEGEASGKKFELVTAFEVFEHLQDPIATFEEMAGLSDSIFLSTRLQPQKTFSNANEWWYFSPEIGQHIAFYNRASLEKLAQKFGMRLYTNGGNLHLLTKRDLPFNPVKMVSAVHYGISYLFGTHFKNRRSLINKDLKLAESKITRS